MLPESELKNYDFKKANLVSKILNAYEIKVHNFDVITDNEFKVVTYENSILPENYSRSTIVYNKRYNINISMKDNIMIFKIE